ncbi:MAG: carboxylesterase family protein [Planctomycetota bacterium]
MLFKDKVASGLRIAAAVLLLNCVLAAGPAKEGQPPPFSTKLTNVPGGRPLSMSFKSRIDGSTQPFLAKVPHGYTPEKKWPLLVTLHGLNDGPILAREVESMVQIGPFGRGSVWYTGIGEQDIFECIEAAKNKFSIDEKRLYLCGFSMGGVGTFQLGLRHPDFWAACVPVCGRWEELDTVENGRNLPFWINTGSEDRLLPPHRSKGAFERAKRLGFSQWRYSEHRGMGHSFGIDWKEVEAWLLTKEAAVNPKHVSMTVRDLSANRAYWVEVTGLDKYGVRARVSAAVEGQAIDLTTTNVSGYVLRLNSSLVDLNKEVEVRENGRTVFKGRLNDDASFAKPAKGKHSLLKRPGLSGPLWDVYCSSSLLVYGTNTDDDSLVDAAKRCARSFSDPRWMNTVHFKIVPDTVLTTQNISDNNLVLFGNAQTNSVLGEISQRLPVKMNGNAVFVGGKEYSGENMGYVLIYPNPLNSSKYAAVFAGGTAETIDCFKKIWPRLDARPQSIDVGVFELNRKTGSVKWHMTGVFGTNWDWPDM